jgi:secreted PhoX family phosphatase
MRSHRTRWILAIVAVLTLAVSGIALASGDFGSETEKRLNADASDNFGVSKTLPVSSNAAVTADQANADPRVLIKLAGGLRARVVSTTSGPDTDMIALWPDSAHPTHLIVCNEGDVTDPGMQRIDLATGVTDTIVTGTDNCDPVRRTAWGTILFGEEAGNSGQVYELIDPLNTTGVTLDRTTGTFSGGTNPQDLVRRTAVGRVSFEGLGLLPNGVLYFGDELRPSSGKNGGSYYKFVPGTPFTGGAPITSLAQSPLVSGKVFALKIGHRNGDTDWGQGSNTGQGAWVPLCNDTTATPSACTNLDLGALANASRLTGYYRPEDLHYDPVALQQGNVRLCGNNTGIEADHNYGETVCFTDGTVAQSLDGTAVPELQYLVIGTPQLAMADNLDLQPGRRNVVINEDGDQLLGNNDIWSCLPDGTDSDLLSDGCGRIMSLNDPTAETTGGIFNASGSKYYVSIQHNITGQGVVLEITGWR